MQPLRHSRKNCGQVSSASPMKIDVGQARRSNPPATVTHGPPTTVKHPRCLSSVRISFIRNRCTLIPVTPTMSARAHRSQSIGSTFSSISVTVCSRGVSAASSGRHATGRLAGLPMNGNACSIPQYDTSKRGLMSTISAIVFLSLDLRDLGNEGH